MKTEDYRKVLKFTSPILSKLHPRFRLFLAKQLRNEGIRTLLDPNSIRNYANIRNKSYSKIVRLKSGMLASLDLNDIIGFRTALNGEWDNTSLEIVKKFPVKETLYLDIGANTGLTSIPIAKMGYKTVGFEPNPHALTQLTKNLALNSPLLFFLFPFAIGAGDENVEYVELHSPVGNMGATSIDQEWSPGFNSSNKVYAPIFSLEHVISSIFSEEQLDNFNYLVIKLDVEGYEDRVIQGLGERLKSMRPIVIFENNPPRLKTNENERFWSKLDHYNLFTYEDRLLKDFWPEKRNENVLALPVELMELMLRNND